MGFGIGWYCSFIVRAAMFVKRSVAGMALTYHASSSLSKESALRVTDIRLAVSLLTLYERAIISSLSRLAKLLLTASSLKYRSISQARGLLS